MLGTFNLVRVTCLVGEAFAQQGLGNARCERVLIRSGMRRGIVERGSGAAAQHAGPKNIEGAVE